MRGEIARCLLLAVAAAWLLHPYFTTRQIGAGDALWYANILGDYVTQARAGVFPIFAGQTDFAFNGSVYPLRAAPLYQHVAALLDFLTAHQLGFFALQHLFVVVAGFAGIFSTYLCLVALAPTRRWEAAGLATLYLSCPGVLATLFTQDLYMTWLTVPFLPVAIFAGVRSFRRDDWLGSALLAGSLAALWWAHAPIAFWITAAAFFLQLVRLLAFDRNRYAWLRAIGCAALFGVLAQYPFVSIKALQTSGLPATLDGLDHVEALPDNIAAAFPADLQPLSPAAAQLSDIQLGYGLWVILLVALLALAVVRLRETVFPLLVVAGVIFLLFPFPGNRWVYLHLPVYIQRLTYYWPMQRLYLLLAAIVAAVGIISLDLLSLRSRKLARSGRTVLALACVWALWESRQFARAGVERTLPADVSARHMLPENRLLMNHQYGLFATLPPYFSNGTMSAEFETRLLDANTREPLPDPAAPSLATVPAGTAANTAPNIHSPVSPARSAAPATALGAAPSAADEAAWHPLVGHIDENPGIIKMDTEFVLQPGRRYELSIVPHRKNATGILQIAGPTFFREYILPASGQPRAFGAGDTNSHSLPLWTTSRTPEQVEVRFIPTSADEHPADFADFGFFAVREVYSDRAPVQLLGLMPFRAVTRASVPTILETPRMYQPGYIAEVDGHPVTPEPTSTGLTAIPLSAGPHEVMLRFVGPLLLRFSYALSLTSWILFLTAVPVLYITRLRPQRR